MLSDRLRRHRGALASTASVVAVVGVVATVAIAFPGFSSQRLDLDDGAVWVANQESQAIGRANPGVFELNTVIETEAAAPRIVQSGATVLVVDSVSATLDIIDPVTAQALERVPLPPDGPEVMIDGGRVVIHAAGTGETWVVPLAELGDFDPASPAILSLGAGSRVIVDERGSLFALSPALGEIYRLELARSVSAARSWDLALDPEGDYRLSSVAGRWVVLDVAQERLILDQSTVSLAGFGPLGTTTELQLPSAEGETIHVATPGSVLAVPVGGGEARPLVEGQAGRPAPPLIDGDCVYAAWSGGTAWRDCAEEAAVTFALAQMPGSAVLGFARNAGQVVLTDPQGGGSWAVTEGGELIDNWAALITPEQEREERDDGELPPEIDPQQKPPVAVDDEFGARPGRATVLPVLANDFDPNGDVLLVSEVEQLEESRGRVDLVASDQQLLLTLPADASGQLRFRYTISDGRGGSATAMVTVTVHAPDQNSAPQQLRAASVQLPVGGRASISVLGDWFDPDGDPVYLSSAAAVGSLTVSATPQGTVVISDPGDGPSRGTVALTVSDGRESSIGFLEVEVSPRGEVPIVVDPRVVLASVGDEITVRPLDFARGGSAPIRLSAFPQKTGVAAAPSFETGSVALVGERVGTHYLSFTVTDGDQTALGVIRLEVAAPAEIGTRPVTVPQTVFVRVLESATVDPTATDIDPGGGVLVVTGVSESPVPGVRAEILEQRRVRVSLGAPLDDGIAVVEYRISNGIADARGTITVVQIPEPERIQAPVASDDAATVRVGDVVDVRVLENDEHPDGLALELVPELADEPPPGSGLAFVSGDRVRFLAPEVAGNYSAIYTVRGIDGQTAQATVRFSVREVDAEANNAPVPRNVTARVLAGETVHIDIPLSGIDPDGDAVQLIGLASNPEKGNVTNTLGGTISYEAGEYSSGTDSFSYTVVDGLGARAEGVIRVGISPRLEGARNPVANEDIVAARPGRTVSVQVLANDTDPDGSPLRVVRAEAGSDDTSVEVVDDAILRITPPPAPGRHTVQYTIENEYGGTSSAFVTVNVDPEAPLAVPVARDTILRVSDVLDRSSVEVDVLDRVFFAEGDTSALRLSLVPGHTSSAELLPDSRIRVTIGRDSQIIPFSVAHPEDASVRGFAFVWVPGYDDALPQLDPTAPELVVASESTLRIDLDERIVALGGGGVRLVDAGAVRATHANGAELVVDETTLEFTSADRYFGPASITVEVTDGASADDPDGRRAVVTIPITVTPRENQPPVFVGAVVDFEPGQSKELDLVRLTNYPYDDIDELQYSLLDPLPEGFTVEVNGQRVVITAGVATPTGSRASARLAVRDAINVGRAGVIQLSIVPSTRALPALAPDREVATRGATTVVDVLANDEPGNPFPGNPLAVVAIRGLEGAGLPTGLQVTPSADRSRLTVQVASTAEPQDTTLQYQVADATGDPSRYVWGSVTISVQDVPDPVRNFRVTGFGDRELTTAWNPSAANNSPITGYRVTATPVAGGAPWTTSCAITVNCTIAMPGNGPDNAVRLSVVAMNEIGGSASVANPGGSIWSDIVPPSPEVLSSQPLDRGLAVSWRKPAGTDAASPITRYVVTVAGETRTLEVRDSSDPPGTTYTLAIDRIAGVSNGDSLGYSVSARNSAPTSLASWNSASGTGVAAWTPLVVGRPSASGVSSASGTTVQADWSTAFGANGREISNYRAAIATGNSAPDCMTGPRLGTATSTTFRGLAPDQLHTVAVCASNGLGGWSAAATTTVTTRATPGTVTAVVTSDPAPSGVGRWDSRLESMTHGSVPAGHVQFQLRVGGAEGTKSAIMPIESAILRSADGSHYGAEVSVRYWACAVWPETTRCSAQPSAYIPIEMPVENLAPSGLRASVVEPSDALAHGRWEWQTPPSGDYEAIEYRCDGVTWADFGEAAGACDVPPEPLPGQAFEIRITANDGKHYERRYDWDDFDRGRPGEEP